MVTDFKDQPPSPLSLDRLPDIFLLLSDHSTTITEDYNLPDHRDHQNFPKTPFLVKPELFIHPQTKNYDFSFKNHVLV